MACLHSIQIYVIGLEVPNLKVKPFNACNATDVDYGYNNVHWYRDEFVIIIWSAVVLALVHILFEMMLSRKEEQAFFIVFLLSPYHDRFVPDYKEDIEFRENAH